LPRSMPAFALPRPSLTVVLIAALSSGCAMFAPSSDCKQFDEQRRQMRYSTEYRFERDEEPKPFGNQEFAVVTLYQLKISPQRARYCSHITIDKELALVRRENTDIVFEETREIFSGTGARIATKTEVVQLRKNGRYAASVPLPIPRNAPAGKYNVVSRLMVRMGNGKSVMIARADADFEVAPSKK
jgi:hypothetical protein